jgi:hypothetical protein
MLDIQVTKIPLSWSRINIFSKYEKGSCRFHCKVSQMLKFQGLAHISNWFSTSLSHSYVEVVSGDHGIHN